NTFLFFFFCFFGWALRPPTTSTQCVSPKKFKIKICVVPRPHPYQNYRVYQSGEVQVGFPAKVGETNLCTSLA
ncbi:MAG: hypothetical protein ACK46E_24170, partial [Pseudanabaena sp.]